MTRSSIILMSLFFFINYALETICPLCREETRSEERKDSHWEVIQKIILALKLKKHWGRFLSNPSEKHSAAAGRLGHVVKIPFSHTSTPLLLFPKFRQEEGDRVTSVDKHKNVVHPSSWILGRKYWLSGCRHPADGLREMVTDGNVARTVSVFIFRA